MDYIISPPEDMLETTVQLPLSKSLSARRMLIDAISGITSDGPVADCDDISVLREALNAANGSVVNVGASGTALRFLTAFFAATPNRSVTIDGCERLRQRPLSILVDALRSMGADIQYVGVEGFAPITINGQQLSGGDLEIDASVSSQFISALMLLGPTMDAPLNITLLNNIASAPYIKMTAVMMEQRGAQVEIAGQKIIVNPGAYTSAGAAIEPDWSAASYWYAITAISAGWVTLPALQEKSLQGDSAIRFFGEQLGVVTNFDDEDAPDSAVLSASPEQYGRISLDMTATPDLVPAITVTACTLGIPFHLTGVKTLHDKECDRVDALCREMLKLGCILECDGPDNVAWDGRRVPVSERPIIDTYGDHRMAMAFAPVSIFVPGIVIRDVEVVAKSYPDFWQDLTAAGFSLREWPLTESTNDEEGAQ